jgi:hypothetical protein
VSGPCRGCGRKLEWAKTPKGHNVPLERVPVVTVDEQGVAWENAGTVLVNHFKTCPKSQQFSGKGKVQSEP